MAHLWLPLGCALLGPFQFGLALVGVSSTAEALSDAHEVDPHFGGAWISAALLLGVSLGSLLSPCLAQHCRRGAHLWVGGLFFFGSLLSGFSTKHRLCWEAFLPDCLPILLVMGRLSSGLASGLSMELCPRYLSRESTLDLHCTAAGCIQLCVAGGMFVGLSLGLPYGFDAAQVVHSYWWRVVFLAAAIPAGLQFILALVYFFWTRIDPSTFFKPDQDRPESSVASRGELSSLDRLPSTGSARPADGVDIMSIGMVSRPCSSDLLKTEDKRLQRSMQLAIQFGSHSVGTYVISMHSVLILQVLGADSAVIGSIAFAFCYLVASCFLTLFLSHMHRPKLAVISFAGMAVNFLAFAFLSLTHPALRGPLAGVLLTIGFPYFLAGSSSLIIAPTPEIEVGNDEGPSQSVPRAAALLMSFFLVLVFPMLLDAVSLHTTFLISSLMGMCALVVVLMM